jgi:hypothetical protein
MTVSFGSVVVSSVISSLIVCVRFGVALPLPFPLALEGPKVSVPAAS